MKEVSEYLINNYNKVKINSKDIVKNDVFIALAGKKEHGNKYISEAINNGAKYIISDLQPKNIIKNKELILVEDTLIFLLNIATRKRNLFKGKVIGITGSIGKTSVKENLKFFLSKLHKISASIKSYNNYLGIIISLINIDLQTDFAIFEMGTSDFFEIRQLTSIIMPSQVIITNIFPTHLEKLVNTRNIAKEKSDIFSHLYNPNVEMVVLPNDNVDEKFLVELASIQKIQNIYTFGKDLKSFIKINKIEKINNNNFKITFIIQNKENSFVVNRNQIHRINNILICFLVCKYNNYEEEIFISLTNKIPLIEGRGLQHKISLFDKKINLIDESYNASPESMKICVDYFEEIKIEDSQKKIIILGDMKELGNESINFHIELLEYVGTKNLKNIIICGEFIELALDKLKNNKILNNRVKIMTSSKSILKYLVKILKNDDIILIKGSNSALTNNLSYEILKKGNN